MNKNIDNIILNLKIISKIPENCKISRNTSGNAQLITLDNSKIPFFKGFKRFIFGDNRTRSINDISDVINSAIDKINDIINSVVFQNIINCDIVSLNTNENNFINNKLHTEYTIQRELLFNLYSELEYCTNGILNLKVKYKDDTIITSKIDIILTKITNYTTMIKKQFFS